MTRGGVKVNCCCHRGRRNLTHCHIPSGWTQTFPAACLGLQSDPLQSRHWISVAGALQLPPDKTDLTQN